MNIKKIIDNYFYENCDGSNSIEMPLIHDLKFILRKIQISIECINVNNI